MNNKEKRRRPSTSESNNSFVKNVTSRVSGFLPSTITKWFSSPRSSDANGSVPTADATDSSTEDEDPESPVTPQPPAKRMRYSSPGEHTSKSTETTVISSIEITEPQSTYSSIQYPPGRNTFRRETNFVSTPIQSAKEDNTLDRSERDTDFKTENIVSVISHSVVPKRKSIFDFATRKEDSIKACEKTSYNTMRDPKRPCFKPGLLGSPFYSGRTMYGGAASSYINQPNIQHRKVVVNEAPSNNDISMSQSARRIMDLLEHYSSPINEARRIPNITRASINGSINSSTDSLSRSADKVMSYKTQELHVPSIASILRLKKRSRLMDTTNAARQLIASHSSASDFQPYISGRPKGQQTEKEQSNKITTKVKSRLTRPCRGDDPNELLTPVKLPTGVLQIEKDNLPKFMFEKPVASKQASAPPAFPPVTSTQTSAAFEASTFTKIAQSSSCTAVSNTSNNLFKFSSPVTISHESQQTCTTSKFTFGSPERSIDKPTINKSDNDPSIVVGGIKNIQKSTNESNDWKCTECWVFNKISAEKCVCCGCKVPSKGTDKSSNSSVCKLTDSQPHVNKCVNCEKIPVNNISKLPAAKSADLAKWTCDGCWVSNDETADKCVCCGSEKTKQACSAVPKEITTKPSGKDWTCDDCWVVNKGGVEKCPACGGAKPGAKVITNAVSPITIVTSSVFKPSDNKLMDIVKSQKEKWECSSCSIRNENDKSLCVCCGMDRDIVKNPVANKSFNFGMNPNNMFKFGIDHNAQAATLPKTEVMFTQDIRKLEESETNNNILAKTPTFTFTLPVKKSNDPTIVAKDNTEEAPKLNFTFGIPKMVSPESVHKIKLIESAKKVTEETEKPQEVPKIDLLSTVQEKPKIMGGFFNAPLNLKPGQNKPLTVVSSVLDSTINGDKQEIPSNPLKMQSNPENMQQKNAFSYSPSGNKINMNLFGSSTSTAVTAGISLVSPLQSAPTTTGSVMGLFRKSESNTPSTISLFQQSNTATTSTVTLFHQKHDSALTTALTTATTVSLASTGPIFSFGSNTSQVQSTAPASDKPKFNFSFGNNTDTKSMFSASFGSTGDNAAGSNKFSLPIGTHTNTIGSGITLSGNPQSGNNGLPAATTAGTALGGLLSAGKPLGGNDLSNNNNMSASNGLQTGSHLGSGSSGIIFGTPIQKEDMWSSKTSGNNMFAPNSTASTMQKPAFTFGSATPFNANTTQAFGGGTQPTQNMFGMSNQNANSQASMFPNPTQSQTVPNIFGAPQPPNNPVPSMGLFGAPNVGATPTFGVPNPSIPSFETPTLTSAQAPAFNFGAPQSSGIFGFGQQQQTPPQQQHQQQQQQQQAGMYNFGAASVGTPQVQFNVGSAPNTAVRRVRKAVRRHQQR